MERPKPTPRKREIQDASELAELLDAREGSPGQYMTMCPAHDDTNPSLSFKQGNNKVLLYCFAGCTYSEVTQAFRRIGINLNSYSQDWPAGVPASWNNKFYVAHWTYRSPSGEPVGHVVRYESYTGERDIIPFFNRESDEKWKPGYPKDQPRPLYNLEKINQGENWAYASVDLHEEFGPNNSPQFPPDCHVWVVEGEKCADALGDLGCLATTSPGGSNAARLADWSPLRGRAVYIWPDKDRAGTVYAGNVVKTLMEGDSDQKIYLIKVDNIPELNEKDDVCDWIKKGFGAKDIPHLPCSEIRDLDDLDIIVVDDAQIYEAIDKAEEAFMRVNPYAIFQRSGLIMRVQTSPTKQMVASSEREGEDFVGLREVKPEHLLDLWNRHLTFAKIDRKGALVAIDPPTKITTRYLARGEWKLSPLSGLIYAPTLRPNGAVLERPGYDETSGLFYVDTGARFAPLKGTPSFEDALTALDTLRYLLSDFPFVEPEDESVALAAIVTALVRQSLRTAPMFAFTAPVAGSGKTLLADVVSIIATGKQAVPMPHGGNREETRKALFAKLLMGSPITLIDNVEWLFSNDVVCAILTAPGGTYSDRVLGESQIVEVPTNVTFLVTGNNLLFKGDITRRVLLCTIDPACEKPEERDNFRINGPLGRHVQQHRETYVEAALTIPKAYIRAGRPKQDLKQYGSFEDFSDLVRSALVWLGCVDPVLTKNKVEEEDPSRKAFHQVIGTWSAEWFDRPVTAAEIAKACNDALESGNPESTLYQLGETFREVTRSKSKHVDSAAVGRWLRDNRNKLVGNLKIIKDPLSAANVATWRLVSERGEISPIPQNTENEGSPIGYAPPGRLDYIYPLSPEESQWYGPKMREDARVSLELSRQECDKCASGQV